MILALILYSLQAASVYKDCSQHKLSQSLPAIEELVDSNRSSWVRTRACTNSCSGGSLLYSARAYLVCFRQDMQALYFLLV